MRTYKFGLPNSDRVIEIVAGTFNEARAKFKQQLINEGLLIL
jgi:hypothetical protein